jgi:hypothetical protein
MPQAWRARLWAAHPDQPHSCGFGLALMEVRNSCARIDGLHLGSLGRLHGWRLEAFPARCRGAEVPMDAWNLALLSSIQ